MPTRIWLMIAGIVLVLLSLQPSDILFHSKVLEMLSGFALIVVGLASIIISKLYVNVPADKAIVRTGLGGTRVKMDGMCPIMPGFHVVAYIPLSTIKLTIERCGDNAIIITDPIDPRNLRKRVDITVDFFVRVPLDRNSVFEAATRYGNDFDEAKLMHLLDTQLVSAVRSVVAATTYDQLKRDTEHYAMEIQEAVSKDRGIHPLTIESVRISHMRPAPDAPAPCPA